MARPKPYDLNIGNYPTYTGIYRSKRWFNGTRVAIRKRSRRPELSDLTGSVIGRDRYRPRWLLVNCSDGSVNWFHVDKLSIA